MAYSACTAAVAANIQIDCSKPIVAGYTGRGVLIPYNTTDLALTINANNPRILNAVAIGTSAHICVIDNVMTDPFSGSTKAGNTDSGFPKYTKTVAVKIPMRGALASKEVVEPLANQPLGSLLILEKKDKSGKGSFEVIGLNDPAHCDVTSISQSESENGGAWVMNFVSTENFAECEFQNSDTTYASTLADFENLLAKGF